MLVNVFKELLGVEHAPVSHIEKMVSAFGGCIAIAGIVFVSRWTLDPTSASIIIASMGASAVLLFVVPHSTLSQPWAVIAGHMISAFIGVTCTLFITEEIVSASLAVGCSIAAMYYLNCLHPPGGATALSAVLGAETTQTLAYQFMLTPVLLNVVIILSIAIVYNYLFHWRRYPSYLQRIPKEQETQLSEQAGISHADFQYALSQIDSFIDVSEEDLRQIYQLASQSRDNRCSSMELKLGAFYSNGEYGSQWSVRQVVDESHDTDPEKDMVIYKGVAGNENRTSGCITRTEFKRWARYQVFQDGENWKRVRQD